MVVPLEPGLSCDCTLLMWRGSVCMFFFVVVGSCVCVRMHVYLESRWLSSPHGKSKRHLWRLGWPCVKGVTMHASGGSFSHRSA